MFTINDNFSHHTRKGLNGHRLKRGRKWLTTRECELFDKNKAYIVMIVQYAGDFGVYWGGSGLLLPI